MWRQVFGEFCGGWVCGGVGGREIISLWRGLYCWRRRKWEFGDIKSIAGRCE
jgi:hypothetical protein